MPVGPTVERDPAIKTFDSLDDEIKHEPVINNYELRKDRPYWSRIQNRIVGRGWSTAARVCSTNKVYCFPCRFFSRYMDAAKIRGHDAFISKGFDCWKHALSTDRGFTKHEVSDLHQTCTELLANRQRQLDNSDCSSSIHSR